MRHLKLLSVFTILLNTLFISGQTIYLEGTVKNVDNEEAIPNITILTKDGKIGTATNHRGEFSLSVSPSFADSYLFFSGIGFKRDSVLITKDSDKYIIKLRPEIYVLQDVYVIPDSTLFTLLKNAFNKIADNYPLKPSAYLGFYRESMQDETDEHINFTESVLHTYKDSYIQPSGLPGQIEIIKSRKRNFKNIGSSYLGGPFLIINMDAVLNKRRCIDPRHFNEYEYQFNGVVSKGRESFYSISWKKKDSKKDINKSTMYIEKESLAYAEFIEEEIELSSQSRIKDIRISQQVVYEKIHNLWVLKYLTYKNSHIDKIGNNSRLGIVEYVATTVQFDNVLPIPFERRLGRTESISITADDYNKSEWTDYVLVENDKKLSGIFSFSPQESDNIFNSTISSKQYVKNTFFSILPKLNIEYGVSLRRIDIPSNPISITFSPNPNSHFFELNKIDNYTEDIFFLEALVGYRINKNINFFYSGIYDLGNKNMNSSLWNIGLEYRKNIKQNGYPVFLQTAIAFTNMSYYVNLGTVNNPTSFAYKEKEFNSTEIGFAYGVKQMAITPEFSVKKEISRLLGIKLFVKYYIPIASKDVLKVKEKDGFFLTRKNVEIEKINATININNSYDPWESFKIGNFNVGVMVTIN